MSRFGILLFTLLLAACGVSSQAPSATAVGCGATTSIDYSARSLPLNVSPRPGPDALYWPAPRAPQLENIGIWSAAPILVSGASAYRCGEFLYQDWIYDDHGAAGSADANDPWTKQAYLFSPKAGTLTYPTDAAYANNAADLVEFRVRPMDDATAFRLTMNTLLDAEKLAFTIALGDSPAAVAWPHAANVSSPAEYFLTVHGATAELTTAAGEARMPAPLVLIDLERRQVEVRVAHAAWDPGSGVVRMAAGFGLWDASAGSYLQPGAGASATAPGGTAPTAAALFNVAFRASEPLPDFSMSGRTIGDAAAFSAANAVWWREKAQSAALANGDISEFSAQVDFGKLKAGTNDDSAVPVTGFMNRILASRISYGQGLDHAKECGGISPVYPCDGAMLGQLQPYTIYIPAAPPPASGYGLQLLLHALSANYNQYLNSRHAQQFGDRGTGAIVITPAGRGPDGYYKDTAEADTFEVWADVARHYPLDPDWTSISGYSMGGFGTWRLSTRYPDLFARAMAIVAAARAGDGAHVASLRNVPLMMWTGQLDELQPASTTDGTISEVQAAGLRLDSWRFNTWDHLSAASNDWYMPAAEFLGEARVERNPRRVSYWRSPAEEFERSGVVTKGAYWVTQMVLRDATAEGEIDVTSSGFGLAEPAVTLQPDSTGTYSGGYLEPAPYTRKLQEWAAPAAAPVENKLAVRAVNVSSITIDPARAKVSCGAAIDIDSDGPLQVKLAGCP